MENFLQEIHIAGSSSGSKRKRNNKLTIHLKGDHGVRAAEAWGVRLGKGRNVHEDYGNYD
jgi:hypothetical protein